MWLEFVKCHGSGNDFPLIDARALDLDDAAWGRIAVALSDRGGPVGSDGLLLLTGTDTAPGFRMFNADGSEAETCLNGVRCVARAAFEAGGGAEAVLHLPRSTVAVARAADLFPGVYTVREQAQASLEVATWLWLDAPTWVGRPIAALDSALGFTAVTMPNPHLIAFVDVIDEAELVRIGRLCEAAPAWLPQRANVSFAVVQGDGLFVRTHERGVGLTDSCGSGMAAAMMAACVGGYRAFDSSVPIRTRGGMIRGAAAHDAMVTIEGNATFEWRGAIEADVVTGALGPLHIEVRYEAEVAAWLAVQGGAGDPI